MLTSQGFLCGPSTDRHHGYLTAPLDTAYTTTWGTTQLGWVAWGKNPQQLMGTHKAKC